DIMSTFPPGLLPRLTALLGLSALSPGLLAAADAPVPREPAQIVTMMCAGCHGRVLTGGAGPSLVDAYWNHGNDDQSIARSIREGWALSRMPPFGRLLSEAEISGLVAY